MEAKETAPEEVPVVAADVKETEELTPEPKKEIIDIIKDLERNDPRIGWVRSRPDYQKVVHGWFFSSHENVLQLLLDREKTGVIIELGSWLGRSAEYFARNAPNAMIFAVDLWDNSVILKDKHYCGNPENLAILNVGPLHDRFMSNMWEYKYLLKDGKATGILPLKMDAAEGLRVLKAAGVTPDLVYVDANHHYEGVYRDICAVIEIFPDAHIVGDDYDYPDVRRAVTQCANEHNFTVYESGNKCWTYSYEFCTRERKKRKREQQEQAGPVETQRPKLDGKESLKDLLKMYKNKKA